MQNCNMSTKDTYIQILQKRKMLQQSESKTFLSGSHLLYLFLNIQMLSHMEPVDTVLILLQKDVLMKLIK